MHIIRSVGVLSMAKITGATYACLALIFVPFILLMGLVGTMAGAKNNPFAAFGMVGIVFLALLMPVIYGAFGFVVGAIGALLYNLLAKWVGGLQIELQPAVSGSLAQPTL